MNKNIYFHNGYKCNTKSYYYSENNYLNKNKMTLINIDKIKNKITPSFLGKIVSFTCYFTFGLTGLLFIFSEIFSNKLIEEYTLINTIQSALLGILSGSVVFLVGLISTLIKVLLVNSMYYELISTIIYSNLALLIFFMVSIFALIALMGKQIILPGTKSLIAFFLN